MSGQISENPILTDLCEVVSRPVDVKSMHRARLHLLDWIGCAAAGAQEPAGQILIGQMANNGLSRAFTWGGLGNILEMDDVDKRALLHPGPTIVPAVLAAAGNHLTSMNDLLRGIVKGYEATIRLGRAVGATHYALFHSTGTCGAIGAAVACASLLSLTKVQLAHAMALAVSQSAGLWHTRHDAESMGKQLHTAVAARAGLQAAMLARDGYKGPLRVLEGEQGFFQAICPGGDPLDILAEPDAEWVIHDVSFKPWPACRHAHAVIDAALELKSKLSGSAPDKIDVRTYEDALKFCDRPHPKTVIEAKFSLQHAVAIVLARGAPGLEDFEMEAINAPDVQALRSAVQVAASDVYQAVYPAHFGAEVECDGHIVRVPDALGDPENPVSLTQIRDKAIMLMRAGDVSQGVAETITDKVMTHTGSSEELLSLISQVLS